VYGAGTEAFEGLRVPGAVDFLLRDLISPHAAGELREPPETRSRWDPDGLPWGMGDTDMWLHETDVERIPELGPFRSGRRTWSRYPSRVNAIIVDPDNWVRESERVIGVRAPELCAAGYTKPLAEAEREVRRARRLRDTAVSRRIEQLRVSRERGIEPYKLARVLGVSRARVHQLLQAGLSPTSQVSPESTNLQGLIAAQRDLAVRDRHLLGAERARRGRVWRASTQIGMGLGEIAAVLDISRGRVQQLVRAEAAVRAETGKGNELDRMAPGSRQVRAMCTQCVLGPSGRQKIAGTEHPPRTRKARIRGPFVFRASQRTRTADPFITSEVLYQLS